MNKTLEKLLFLALSIYVLILNALYSFSAEGMEKGMEQMAIRIARNLLESDFPIDLIAQNTGLSLSQIEHLKGKT